VNENECALAVEAWVVATLPALQESRHFLSGQKTLLPDVMVDVAEKRIATGDERFPFAQIQQAWLRVFELDLLFMVEHHGGEADKDEQEELRAYGRDLEGSLLEDATLGDRVQMASPNAIFNYRLPFVQYADGTRGRQLSVNLAVAELAPVEAS